MKSKYMKRIMLLATAVLTMSSCDSFLDTSPEDLRSPEQIYETYSSTQNAMFGVYSYIRGTYPFDMPDTYSTSDVDVAYEGTPNLFLRVRMKMDLEKLFGCKVDLIRLRKQFSGTLFGEELDRDLIYV